MLRLTRTSVRCFSLSKVSFNALPSSQEMKSDKPWAGSDQPTDISKKVVGIARDLHASNTTPLDINQQFTRRFGHGETYDPFDFSQNKLDMEKKEFRKSKETLTDPFERTGIDPSNLYTMPEILSRFITSSGQILPRSLTGCNVKNQRKLANVIKTSRACGLLSVVHKSSRYLPGRNI